MTLTAIAGFSTAMFVLAATPGPGVFAIVSRSLSSGFKKSLFMIAGIVTGDLLYLTFAIFGLTYVARNMGQLFALIRLAGGAYLIWMGIKTICTKVEEEDVESKREDVSGRSAYLSGLLITLSNPKVILFYCGFLPAFVNLNALALKDGMIIVLLVMSILGSVMAAYSRLADSAGGMIRSVKGRRRLNRGAGAVMMAAGAAIAVQK